MEKPFRKSRPSPQLIRALRATLIAACVALGVAAPLRACAAGFGGDPLTDAIGKAIADELLQAYPPGTLFGHSSGREIMPEVTGTHASLSGIKSIAVIRPFEPRNYSVAYVSDDSGDVAGFTDLRGAGDRRAGTALQEAFTASVKQHESVPISTLLTNKIAAQLKRMGYATRIENGPWMTTVDYETIDFDKISSSADAVMIIKPTIVGFIAGDKYRPFQPAVTAIVTVLNSRSRDVLYRGFLASGWDPRSDGWQTSDTDWTFGSYDQMAAQPEKAAAALEQAVTNLSVTMAADLKK